MSQDSTQEILGIYLNSFQKYNKVLSNFNNYLQIICYTFSPKVLQSLQVLVPSEKPGGITTGEYEVHHISTLTSILMFTVGTGTV